MQGVLLIDKPKTWTSFDVVNYVRKIARQQALVERYQVYKAESEKKGEPLDFSAFKHATRLPKVKVGHTGTLDPLATGLLVLLIGKDYTRRAEELTKLDKTYEVEMKLGETSTTGDAEGDITPYVRQGPSLTQVTEDDVLRAFKKFTGQIMQTPPAFSAMKVNGQRAYKLAREGKVVELEARPVIINVLRLVKFEYPYVSFVADVGSGTYIRSLVEDLGKHLGMGAYMSDLRRTRVGQFDIKNALTIDRLDADMVRQNLMELA